VEDFMAEMRARAIRERETQAPVASEGEGALLAAALGGPGPFEKALLADYPKGILDRIRGRYLRRKATMLAYLDLKREEYDLHGIEDAASDLRDIEAALAVLDEIEKG
jgi:hypothetical protein